MNFSDQEQIGVDNYALKRLKNNAAVNKTRQKKRLEQENTTKRVKELREENAQLERFLCLSKIFKGILGLLIRCAENWHCSKRWLLCARQKVMLR